MALGTVKWFNEKKGYGFINQEDGEDVFVHFSAIKEARKLDEGDSVEFEIKNDGKGLSAVDVVII